MALNDEEDDWDEKIKRSLRFEIRLMIKHPNIDPAKITEKLQLEPNISSMVGNPRVSPVGKPLPGIYRESGWSYWFQVERNRLFFRDVAKLIDGLEAHKAFLIDIVEGGGTISLIVSLPGDVNIGDTLRWRDMARLSALHIDLGIEVFPEFN
jgi:hypothetical protein